jgi:hypothetical protein
VTSILFDYPTASITARAGVRATQRFQPVDADRRLLEIESSNVGEQLSLFTQGQIQFASTKGISSLWLEIDFDDEQFER